MESGSGAAKETFTPIMEPPPDINPLFLQSDHFYSETSSELITLDKGEVTFTPIFKDRQKKGPYNPQSYPIPSEKTPGLHHALAKYAGSITVAECMSLAEDRQKPPKNLSDYRFVPLLPKGTDCLKRSIGSLSGIDLDIDALPGVLFEYRRPGDRPLMDSPIGLGLVFRHRLVALCAGGLAEEGPMILQLQDVSNKQPPDTTDPEVLRKFPYSNGLRNGIASHG